MDQKEYLTKEKYDELSQELDHLKKVRRKEVADNLEFAKSLGDLSENAEYHEARIMQAEIEERISKLENILKSAEIVSPHHSTIVDVGSTVIVQKEGEKAKHTYKLVGSEEADTATGKISFRSPLGQAMSGKKKGDSFSFNTPKGQVSYKVIDIE
ncbi:MAG TPA: transcription elongation factor GreA [Candidatus Paceibacterota bacterium]|nr:transcription elongation factor GreA [Candidatus Paceibacterota bacterium]